MREAKCPSVSIDLADKSPAGPVKIRKRVARCSEAIGLKSGLTSNKYAAGNI
ncbi:hypothetical protein LU604_00560 [Erwinia tracheiphila]|uniref:hypothetical protein n=1 Tax=Erwinia tracheiphila TaxID=65700 RepID=UPI001F2874D8|nr:hypothetical protein [Erwinia tracheiphila]UIA83689.1 hypothetical protein LU604_00560 [Erwinia tracheiphila]UIA92271.1 hypothetical protein LU632_00555 [Erwinia tracheiphila]